MNNKDDHDKNDGAPNKGVYHNDYSPRYQEAYDIYEKARLHMKSLKRHSGAHIPAENRKRQQSDTK